MGQVLRLQLMIIFGLIVSLVGCNENSEVDGLFPQTPGPEVIVEVPANLQVTITTPTADGKKVGFEVYMAGGCTYPGGTIKFAGGASGFSVCQANNTWSATVDVSSASVGNITVEATLTDGKTVSGKATRVLNKTNSDCNTAAARAATFAAGNGSIATPYSICTSAQLSNIRTQLTSKFAVKNDIDFQSVPFTGIPNTFSGELDGGGFVLKNLYIYDLATEVGLFKGSRNGAVIKDIIFENPNVTGTSQVAIVSGHIYGTGTTISGITITGGKVSATSNWIGGLVAYVDNAVPLTVSNVNLTFTSFTGTGYGGGVLGGTHATAGAISIDGATVAGTFTSSTSYFGGIVGYFPSASLSLNNVTSTANMTNNAGTNDNYLGGIIGYAVNATPTNINLTTCSSSGTITASGSYIGGVAGRYTGTKLWNCTVNRTITVNSDSRAAGYVGGIVGYADNDATDLYQSTSVVNITVSGTNVSSYYGGLAGYFLGARVQESHAKGVNDSTPGTISINTGDDSTNGSSYIGGAFGRLYTRASNTLTVSTSNANVNITHDDYLTNAYVGGYTGSLEQPTNGATASTTTISNSSATGSVSSYNRYVGGWAGYTYVGLSGSKITLSNVSASGSVTVGTRNSITPHYIGGLIGFAQAYDGGGAFTAPLGYEWSAVSATGNVTVDSGALGGNYVGGLVGYVQSGRTAGGGATSTLSRLSATGTVSVTSSSANFNYVGGLIGRAYAATGATLNLNSTGGQTYATGNVSTDGIYVGGLIGYANTTTNASMTLNDVYSNGTVSGRQYVGGAIGYVSNGTTATMTISDIQSHDSNSATTANTVTATTLNAVGGLFGGADSTGTSFNLSNCDSIASVTGVTGYAGGLIGYDRRNLTISNCSASGNVTSGGQYVGGLTGGSTDTGRAYSDVTASGNVTASVSGATNNIYVGGLSGYMRGTLTRGKAHGDVTIQVNTGATINQAIVGGLIGQANGLPVDQSFARGTVTFTDLTVGNLTYVGGLIGVTNSAVTNSFALGDVSGGQQVGGLLGNSSSTVASSFAAGNVSGQRYVGGLVGNFTLNSAGAVNLTYALGSINRINSASTDYFGQLIGYCNAGLGDTKVTNSYYLDQALPVTGQTVCNSATAARAQSDTAMKTADGTGVVFNGWDFSGTNTNSWRYPTSFSKKGQSVYLYPILYWALP